LKSIRSYTHTPEQAQKNAKLWVSESAKTNGCQRKKKIKSDWGGGGLKEDITVDKHTTGTEVKITKERKKTQKAPHFIRLQKKRRVNGGGKLAGVDKGGRKDKSLRGEKRNAAELRGKGGLGQRKKKSPSEQITSSNKRHHCLKGFWGRRGLPVKKREGGG